MNDYTFEYRVSQIHFHTTIGGEKPIDCFRYIFIQLQFETDQKSTFVNHFIDNAQKRLIGDTTISYLNIKVLNVWKLIQKN